MRRGALLVIVAAALSMALQGCANHRGCKISDVYGMIQVDGRTGLTKTELEKAGVRLCARHMRKEETYRDGACGPPEMVFANDELPTSAQGDVNALLLISCPSNSYPKGKELQRVTCSDDYVGEGADGTIQKELHLHFDNYDQSANCLLSANQTLEPVEEKGSDITDTGNLDSGADPKPDSPLVDGAIASKDHVNSSKKSRSGPKERPKKGHLFRESHDVRQHILTRKEAADGMKVVSGSFENTDGRQVPSRIHASAVNVHPHGSLHMQKQVTDH